MQTVPIMSAADSSPVHIPLELQIEILSRIPAISVLRFRSVCKTWSVVTRTSSFTTTHYSRSGKSDKVSGIGNLLLYSTMETSETTVQLLEINYRARGRDWSLPTLSTHDFHPRLFLAAEPSNGFLCLTVDSNDPNTNHTYLHNPTTREMLKLPIPTNSYSVTQRSVIGFVFDPPKEEFNVVYSVTCSDLPTYVTMYTGKFVGKSDRPWSVIGALPYEVKGSQSVMVNGNLHWLISEKRYALPLWRMRESKPNRFMISLDLEEEKFQQHSMEKVLEKTSSWSSWSVLYLTKFQDSLAVLEESKLYFRFWIMKEYKNVDSWNLMYTFCCPPLKECRVRYPSMPLYCLWKDETILFCYCSCIMAYDPKKNKAEALYSFTDSVFKSNLLVVPFVSSLFSLKNTFIG